MSVYETWLEAIAERNDLAISYAKTFSHTVTVDGVADSGKAWRVVVAGQHSAEAAASAMCDALLERHARFNACDSCLGTKRVPSSEMPGQLAGCGDCYSGDADSSDTYTAAQRDHDFIRNNGDVK